MKESTRRQQQVIIKEDYEHVLIVLWEKSVDDPMDLIIGKEYHEDMHGFLNTPREVIEGMSFKR